MVIPALVVAEVSYLLGARLGPRADATFMRALATEDVEPPTSEDYARIAQLVEVYADFPLGGVDASVIALAEPGMIAPQRFRRPPGRARFGCRRRRSHDTKGASGPDSPPVGSGEPVDLGPACSQSQLVADSANPKTIATSARRRSRPGRDAAGFAGARALFADAEEPLDDPDGPSRATRNLLRAGFKQVSAQPVCWRPPE